MAKNNDVTKSRTRTRPKSIMRKPLRDVSNGGAVKPPSKSAMKRPTTVNRGGEQQVGDDEALDRLLLVHSDLSSLIHQIDELVVQALKSTSKKERKEIESFADALSEMHVSLKPWVARFQRSLSSLSPDPENKLDHSSPSKAVPAVNEDTSNFIPSPEETKWDSLVSPSPLVSWRPDSNIDGGKQLFLLTPLPRPKAFSSKCPESTKSELQRIVSDTIVQPSHLFNMVGKMDDDLIEGVFVKPTPREVSNSDVINAESTMERECDSPAKIPVQSSSVLFMTPRLKMSPPKSCVLLEPISELSHKENHGIRKSTPFPVGVQKSSFSQESESSGSQASEHLTMKYAELFGLRVGHDFGNRRKVVEESPNWLMSPPKTCVLMEPPDEKLVSNAASEWPLPRTAPILVGQSYSSLKEDIVQGMVSLAVKSRKKELDKISEIVEGTPLLKEPESNLKMGKQPGENTLKRELWTKFDAVSTRGIRCNASLLQKTAQKGFLDRLDEVSRE